MLKHLKYADIDAIVAVCKKMGSKATGLIVAGKDIDISSPDGDQLYKLIAALPTDARKELLALMWTGGTEKDNSFADNLDRALKSKDSNEAAYIAAKAMMLATYIEAGIKRLDEDGSFYREIGYTTDANGNGTWQWKIHPPIPANGDAEDQRGQSRSDDEANLAAKAAIDKFLAQKRRGS